MGTGKQTCLPHSFLKGNHFPRCDNGITIVPGSLPISPGYEAIYPYLWLHVWLIYPYTNMETVYLKISNISGVPGVNLLEFMFPLVY